MTEARYVDAVPGRQYRFYSIAIDNVGNFEQAPEEADAVTFVREPATVVSLTLSNLPQPVIDIEFSDSMDVQRLIEDGSIVDAVTLLHVPHGPIQLSAGQFTYDGPAKRLHWTCHGALPIGYYEFTIDSTQVTSNEGAWLRGDRSGLVFETGTWNAVEVLQSAGEELAVDGFSVPLLADWNGDGLLDLVVGEKTANGEGKVRVYLNQGTAETPVFDTFFHAQTADGDLAVPASGCLGVFPRFVDWNGDGNNDLLLGLADGRIQIWLNEGSDSDPILGSPTYVQVGEAGEKADIDVGGRAAVDIADWNNDGRPDLIVGGLDGRVRVYLDAATSGEPDFREAIVVQDGSADLVVPGGRSSPAVVDLDGDGRKDLVMGNSEGQVVFFPNTDTDAAPAFGGWRLIEAGGSAINLPGSARSRVFVGDYNDDGWPDLLIGAGDGYVRLALAHTAPGPAPGAWTIGTPGTAFVYGFMIPAAENVAPVVEDFSADPDPITRPGQLTLTAEGVHDPDGTVVRVAFYHGAELLGIDADGSDGWTWTVSTAGWTLGEHSFTARAQDDDGAWSEPDRTTVTVENAAPVIDELATDPSTITRGDQLTLTAAGVSDPDGTVVRVEFWLTEVEGNGIRLGEGIDDNGTWMLFVSGGDTLGWDLGEQTLLARAQDNDGAWSAAAVTIVQVGQLIPTYDLMGRITSTGDWWRGESNGVDAFTNSRVTRWSPNVDWVDVMVGDFTGNGLDDIAGRAAHTGDWWVAVNNGDSTFTNQRWTRWSPNVDWVDVMVGDFTGDGKADIAGRAAHTGDWWIAQSTGTGFVNERWTRWSTNVEWVDVMAANFTGDPDGKVDIAGRAAHTGDWWVAASTGTGFVNARWTRWSPNVDWGDVMAADFTGDGVPDIAGRAAHSGDWWVAESTGAGFTNARWTRWSPNVDWGDVMAADFTGDGRADIAGRAGHSGDWWVAESTNAGFTNARWTRWSPSVDWVDVMAADFTGDGKADIAGRAAHTGDWWIAESTGAGFTNARWTRWSRSIHWSPVLAGNFASAAAALHAAYAPSPSSQLPAPNSQLDLQSVVEEAVLRMPAELEGLAFQVRIVDLPGLMLGRTVGDTIQIDHNAAGFGWYLNPTDADFQPGGRLGELSARAGTDAVHRIDLLTVVMHELGQLLGYGHAESGLMQPALGPGTRWLPESDGGSDLAYEEALLDDESLQPDRLDAYFAALG